MVEQAYPCPLAKDKDSKGYFSDSLSYVAAEPQLERDISASEPCTTKHTLPPAHHWLHIQAW